MRVAAESVKAKGSEHKRSKIKFSVVSRTTGFKWDVKVNMVGIFLSEIGNVSKKIKGSYTTLIYIKKKTIKITEVPILV